MNYRRAEEAVNYCKNKGITAHILSEDRVHYKVLVIDKIKGEETVYDNDLQAIYKADRLTRDI